MCRFYRISDWMGDFCYHIEWFKNTTTIIFMALSCWTKIIIYRSVGGMDNVYNHAGIKSNGN
jgi:hypothetical protein